MAYHGPLGAYEGTAANEKGEGMASAAGQVVLSTVVVVSGPWP